MSASLTILQAGPALSLQDLGRPGFLAQGLTKGGASDPTALNEGAALLRQSASNAVIEMAGTGGSFRSDTDIRIALTGAKMAANIDGDAIIWNASHLLPAGATLTIGGAQNGSYGYLHVGGGFATDPQMGSRASHLSAGLGQALKSGNVLPIGSDSNKETGMTLPADTRFGGGVVRVVASMQTEAFAPETRERFFQTAFKRDSRANRMGVRMDHDGEGFSTDGQLSIVSEVIVPGDIQITGDGAPFVLMCECQTTGGYPRIGTVIPCDLPRVAQAQTGAAIKFEFVDMEQAVALQLRYLKEIKSMASAVTPLVRDPANIRDLLSYQLVGGVISANADPFEERF
ncbi:MAG: biotin-dependent carboxyltransferase family protein [Sulfitobacter sp.]